MASGPPRRLRVAPIDAERCDAIVAAARQARDERASGYRDRALRLYPWVCGRCGRSFERADLRELTVHHRDGNHDNNPGDGSNWELLCIYCHDAEHRRYQDHLASGGGEAPDEPGPSLSHQPFAALGDRVGRKG